jgi:hypothetical protein
MTQYMNIKWVLTLLKVWKETISPVTLYKYYIYHGSYELTYLDQRIRLWQKSILDAFVEVHKIME